jgi:hypothetical protein
MRVYSTEEGKDTVAVVWQRKLRRRGIRNPRSRARRIGKVCRQESPVGVQSVVGGAAVGAEDEEVFNAGRVKV